MNFEISLLSFLVAIMVGSLLTRADVFSFLDNRESRFETLDGLRGFLALSVFFHHFVVTYYWKVNGSWTRPPEDYYQNYGKVGVAIFFMITGFLFISKLLNSKWSVDWLKLFKSRIFRIMPIYIFAVAFITLIVFHNSAYQLNSSLYILLKELFKWGVFRGGNINDFENTRIIIAGVDWTLKYEWAFYVLLPVISVFFSKANRTVIFMSCGVVILLFFRPVSLLGFSSIYAILFLVGGISAYIVNFKLPFINKIRSKATSLVVFFLLSGVLFYPRTFDFFHIFMMSVFFILVVLGNDIFGVLRLSSAKLLGEISYSIYLLHGMVLYILFTQLSILDITSLSVNEYSLLMPIVGVLVVIISSITYLYIEKPFIEYGRQYKAGSFLKNISERSIKALQYKNR